MGSNQFQGTDFRRLCLLYIVQVTASTLCCSLSQRSPTWCMCVCIDLCVCVSNCVCVLNCVCVCRIVYIYVCVCVCVCVKDAVNTGQFEFIVELPPF